MTIASPDTIDLVVSSPDDSVLCLVIVATEPLTPEGGYLDQLETKLRTYHHALISGVVDAKFPGYKNASKIIRIDHYSILTSHALELLEIWGKRLSVDEIDLWSSKQSWNPFVMLFSFFSKKNALFTPRDNAIKWAP